MTRKLLICAVALGLGVGLVAVSQARSGEEDQPAVPDMNEMMKMYEQMSQPGPAHAHLAEAVGNWKTVAKSWMGPGEPNVSTGTSKMEMMFGGRYLREHFRCTLLDRPFEGVGMVGYDNHKKKYVSVWFDNFSTGFLTMEGTYDEATKTMTLTGSYDDPFMGPTKLKHLVHEKSPNEQMVQMYTIGADGQEQKHMEITYTRGTPTPPTR